MQSIVVISPQELEALIENALRKHFQLIPAENISTPIEIISIDELCKRLRITRPTVKRWREKNKIPSFTIGSAVRFDYNQVLKALKK